MPINTAQCPACNTRFRVHEQQLKAAEGLVRCGRCQQIFNAAQNTALPTLEESLAAEQNPAQHDSLASRQAAATTAGSGNRDGIEHADAEINSSEATADLNDPLTLLNSLSTVNHDFVHHMPPAKPRRWTWALGNLIVLALLLWQLAWWQMPRLLASPAAPYVASFCNSWQLACQPTTTTTDSTQTLDNLTTRKLVVRKDPQRSDAVIVDTLLINTGQQNRNFPGLLLRFSDINGRTLASRVFQPREYLQGELSELKTMASQQPIHVVLHIRDPGSQAVNYQMRLVTAKGQNRGR